MSAGLTYLPPSGLWMLCPPSHKLCGGTAAVAKAISHDEGYGWGQVSANEEQGQEYHRLAADKLRVRLGAQDAARTDDLRYYDAMMDERTDQYCDEVMRVCRERYDSGQDVRVVIEEPFDLPLCDGIHCRGRSDCIIYTPGALDIIDLKSGRGALVSARCNHQLMTYALAGLELCADADPEIRLTIIQPALHSISTDSITRAELLVWRDEHLIPTARQTVEGTGSYHVGDHCRFCPARPTCRARAEQMQSYVASARHDPTSPTLALDDVAALLEGADHYKAWVDDIRKWATDEAMAGGQVPGYKLIIPRNGARKFVSEQAVVDAARRAGIDPYKRVLRSPREIELQVGTARYEAFFATLISSEACNPKLVPVSDPRPEYRPTKDDFDNRR
ncbi:DUF2800 domain-containing protein [Pseudoflavonifractor phocaeensis]|uniref:DUF2800 domain-containing protein n=1 Tax=Pseudoflavonifractor phocaeensis TaxID=1870988 RepID=UPI00195B9B9D|nr:DUF2800 domain-containing protein [Pseudoflavonifractor phocaeensis]MBM6887032.1 DUF2800 domain-containing protein [Pseudoflavonifractor phocaeensis]